MSKIFVKRQSKDFPSEFQGKIGHLQIVLRFHDFFLFPISDCERSVSGDQYFQTKKQVKQLVFKLSLGTRVNFLKL